MTKKSNKPITVVDLLPNNEKHILRIESELYSMNTKIRQAEMNHELGERFIKEKKERLFKLLMEVGNLSQPAFDLRDKLENIYITKYKATPKLGKKLFLEHYSKIHKPYDKLKNSIWKSINLLLPEDEQI